MLSLCALPVSLVEKLGWPQMGTNSGVVGIKPGPGLTSLDCSIQASRYPSLATSIIYLFISLSFLLPALFACLSLERGEPQKIAHCSSIVWCCRDVYAARAALGLPSLSVWICSATPLWTQKLRFLRWESTVIDGYLFEAQNRSESSLACFACCQEFCVWFV